MAHVFKNNTNLEDYEIINFKYRQALAIVIIGSGFCDTWKLDWAPVRHFAVTGALISYMKAYFNMFNTSLIYIVTYILYVYMYLP